jgi:hypothetical protein
MHYYERNIADINQEYTTFLTHILTPLIYEGLKSMYDKSIEKEKEYIELSKNNIKVKNPGILKIFQHCLKNIPSLNINLIECEMIRIRDSSKHADIFEKLIKAVIKSHIILLTYNASGKQCQLVNEKIHEKIDCKIFIHKIYIECARQFYNNPELFWHGYTNIELKKNQKDCLDIIEKSIKISIKEIIPMQDILTEYLKNDYIIEPLQNRTQKIKEMLEKNPEDDINFFDDEDKKVLITEEELDINNNNNFINENINDIENLLREASVKNEQINENMDKQMNEKQEDNNTEKQLNEPSINEEEYKDKIANFGIKSKNSKIQKLSPQNLNNNIKINNIENNGEKEENNDNIDIIQNENKLDDKNYYNALMFN